jgi:hypothetical protein
VNQQLFRENLQFFPMRVDIALIRTGYFFAASISAAESGGLKAMLEAFQMRKFVCQALVLLNRERRISDCNKINSGRKCPRRNISIFYWAVKVHQEKSWSMEGVTIKKP